jgi:hypothetical protein
MYSPSMYPLLADTVAGLAGPRTTVYWSAQRRDVGVDVGFFDRLRSAPEARLARTMNSYAVSGRLPRTNRGPGSEHGFSIVDLSACRDVCDVLPPSVAALLRVPVVVRCAAALVCVRTRL